jgi:hypothetical protein
MKTLQQDASDLMGLQNKRLLKLEKRIVQIADKSRNRKYRRSPISSFIPNLRLSMTGREQPEK